MQEKIFFPILNRKKNANLQEEIITVADANNQESFVTVKFQENFEENSIQFFL